MALEKTIRDLLVTRLDLLEPGLVHVETEHKLPNVHGSKGSIDILARDALGHRVIIELKRRTTPHGPRFTNCASMSPFSKRNMGFQATVCAASLFRLTGTSC
jgi:hypothetical protein